MKLGDAFESNRYRGTDFIRLIIVIIESYPDKLFFYSSLIYSKGSTLTVSLYSSMCFSKVSRTYLSILVKLSTKKCCSSYNKGHEVVIPCSSILALFCCLWKKFQGSMHIAAISSTEVITDFGFLKYTGLCNFDE